MDNCVSGAAPGVIFVETTEIELWQMFLILVQQNIMTVHYSYRRSPQRSKYTEGVVRRMRRCICCTETTKWSITEVGCVACGTEVDGQNQNARPRRNFTKGWYDSCVMSADARGILRGHCQACTCGAYAGGDRISECVDCGHPPGKHVNLSTSPVRTQGQSSPVSQTHTADHSLSTQLAANQSSLIVIPPRFTPPTSHPMAPHNKVPFPVPSRSCKLMLRTSLV